MFYQSKFYTFMIFNKINFSIVVLISFYGSICYADSIPNFDSQTNGHNNDRKSNFYDEISPYDGNLSLHNIDLTIPGNGGLEIKVERQYNLSKLSANLFSSYKVETDRNMGPGWSLVGIPKIWHQNEYYITNDVNNGYVNVNYISSPFIRMCNKTPFNYNAPNSKIIATDGSAVKSYIELPDGNTEQFFYLENFYQAKTFSNWLLSCEAGNLIVHSPNGVVYDFGNIDSDRQEKLTASYRAGPMGMDLFIPHENSISFFNVKKISDIYGNWLKYEYIDLGKQIIPTKLPKRWSGNRFENVADQEIGYKALSKISSNDGREVNFNYDLNSRYLISIKDNNGRSVEYKYIKKESDLFLSKVVLPNQDVYNYSYYDGEYIRGNYSYMPEHNFTDEKVIKFGHLKDVKLPQGGVITYDYDFFSFKPNLEEKRVMPYGLERVKSKKISSGETWFYKYDNNYEKSELPRKTIINGPLGDEEYTYYRVGNSLKDSWRIYKPIYYIDVYGNKTQYEWKKRPIFNYGSELQLVNEGYNAVSDVISDAELSKKIINRDGVNYITEYKNYDTYGNPSKVIETGPNGESRITNITYYNDPVKWIIGKPKDETTYNGSTLVGSITRNYDSNGNVLSENKDGIVNINTYDAQGNIATSVNANGATTTFSNYKRGIAQTEVQPEGVTITREVDNAGNVISETNGAGQKTSYTYDGLDRVTSITPPVGDKTTITYTATSKTTTRGNLVEVMNYDEFGRPKDSSKDGIKTTYKYDAFDNKIFESNPSSDKGTTISYDALNRVKTITNPDNTKQTYEYGKASTSITDERGKKTTYNYRSYGNPEEQHLMSITAPVADANVTLTRNGRDQVTTVKQKGLTRTYGYNSKYQLTSIDNPETGKTIYGRDNVGNMTSVKVGSSGTTTLTYDGRNRNTSITYPSGTAKVTKTYTKTDKLDMVDNTTVQRKFNYDANDNLSSETLTVDKQTFTTKYGYNTKDQLSSVTYPQSGTVIDYAPDALGRPTKVGNYVTNISYWPSGQFKQLSYANGTVSNYGQNDRLWPSSFDTKKGTVAHLNSNYTYDGVGNLLSITDSTDSNFNRTATYDDINRLITTQGPWGAGTLTYDGMGNITKQKFGSQVLDYVYNSTTNKLTSTSGSKVGTYSYDVMGNITSDGVNTYSYDAVPSLICAKCNDSSKRVDYNYDGLNKRVSVTKAGVKRYEILATNGDQLIEFIPSQNNKLTEYFYLGGKRIAQRISP
ncbi:hypothetical protein V8P49_11540 [Acinetobacter baumannii]